MDKHLSQFVKIQESRIKNNEFVEGATSKDWACASDSEIHNMTANEAVEILQQQINMAIVRKKNGNHGCAPRKHMVKAFQIAQRAILKTIPRKVTHEATLHRLCTCPCCKNVVEEQIGGQRIMIMYCHFCGQKLDWSDETI
jgi:hypothetical protein